VDGCGTTAVCYFLYKTHEIESRLLCVICFLLLSVLVITFFTPSLCFSVLPFSFFFRSRENSENFPTQLRFRSDPVVGLAFRPELDTTQETIPTLAIPTNNTTSETIVATEDKSTTKQSLQVVLRSHGFLCFVDLGAPIPSNARIHPPSHLAAKNDVARRLRHIEQKKRQMKMTVKMLETKKAKDSDVANDNEVKRLRSNSIGSEASITDLTSLRERSDSLNSEGPTDHPSLVTSTSTVEEEEEVDDFNRNFAITLK
jgi:hypothetical protein